MPDEDLEKRAWQMYREAAKTIEFPENIRVIEREDGTITFRMDLYHKASGIGLFIYKPSPSFLINFLTMVEDGDTKSTKEFDDAFSGSLAFAMAYLLLKNFHHELSDAFINIFDVPIFTMMQAMATMNSNPSRASEDRQREWSQKYSELWKDFWAERIKNAESRVMEHIDEVKKSQAPVKHLLASYYAFLIKDWETAKKFYKRNKDLKNWQKMVEAGFEDLPADLIIRLADPNPYEATPSSIALEHAARMCGIKNNSLGLRSLQNLLKDSREWAKKAGEEEVIKEIKKHRDRIIREIEALYRVAKLAGQEIDWSDMPVYHQWLARNFNHVFENIINGTIPEEYSSFEIDDNPPA